MQEDPRGAKLEKIRIEFQEKMSHLESELSDKLRELEKRAFFGEDTKTIKKEGVIRAQSMEQVYQDFRSNLKKLGDETKVKMNALHRR